MLSRLLVAAQDYTAVSDDAATEIAAALPVALQVVAIVVALGIALLLAWALWP